MPHARARASPVGAPVARAPATSKPPVSRHDCFPPPSCDAATLLAFRSLRPLGLGEPGGAGAACGRGVRLPRRPCTPTPPRTPAARAPRGQRAPAPAAGGLVRTRSPRARGSRPSGGRARRAGAAMAGTVLFPPSRARHAAPGPARGAHLRALLCGDFVCLPNPRVFFSPPLDFFFVFAAFVLFGGRRRARYSVMRYARAGALPRFPSLPLHPVIFLVFFSFFFCCAAAPRLAFRTAARVHPSLFICCLLPACVRCLPALVLFA